MVWRGPPWLTQPIFGFCAGRGGSRRGRRRWWHTVEAREHSVGTTVMLWSNCPGLEHEEVEGVSMMATVKLGGGMRRPSFVDRGRVAGHGDGKLAAGMGSLEVGAVLGC